MSRMMIANTHGMPCTFKVIGDLLTAVGPLGLKVAQETSQERQGTIKIRFSVVLKLYILMNYSGVDTMAVQYVDDILLLYRKKFDDFYFLPPPFHLISTHFPDEAAWQLLDDPVSKTEFEKRVYCSSYFTKYSLQLLNHRDAEITTDSDVTICVSCPESKVKSTAYMFSLEFDDEGDLMRSQKCNRLVQYHRTLNGYGMIERLGNVAYFTVRPPEKASYRFIIYAKDIETTAKQEKFQSVCSYEIHMEGQKGMSKFPACPRDRWGDTEFLEKYGIVPERTGAVIETSDGLLDIKLKIPKEMDFQVKIKTVQKFATDLEEIVLYRTVKDEAIFTMTFPKPGEYGLEIYTNGERESEAKMQNIIQYLIIAKSASDPSDMLPAVFPGFLGTKPPFKQLKLSADSHEDPIILTNSSDLEVVFSSPQPVNYSTNLIYISRNKYDDLTDHVLRQGQEGGNEVEFLLKLPFAGWYRFEIYAVSRSEQIQKLPNVFNYLINCHIEQEERSPGLRKPSPYPKQFAMWNGGCCLLEPIGGLTPTGGHLEVKIPEAEEVAVIVDGEWTHLEQDNDSWSGDVTIDAGPGREVSVKVSAQFPNKKAFSTLLQYTINT